VTDRGCRRAPDLRCCQAWMSRYQACMPCWMPGDSPDPRVPSCKAWMPGSSPDPCALPDPRSSGVPSSHGRWMSLLLTTSSCVFRCYAHRDVCCRSNKVCCGVSSGPVSSCPDDHTNPVFKSCTLCTATTLQAFKPLAITPAKRKPTMPPPQRRYSPFLPPTLSMSELVKTTLDHDSTDMLIDKWLEHRSNGHDAYHDWFRDVRERKHNANANAGATATANGRDGTSGKQVIAWNKGEFMPENVFCRTVDTGRLIPLDRTWTTHVYHHQSMQERKLSMMPVVFTMVRSVLFAFHRLFPPLFFSGVLSPFSCYCFGLLGLFFVIFLYRLIVSQSWN